MKPAREHATNNAQTYFVTSNTWERRALFLTESWARLFFKVVLSHRGEAYLLHEFVLMPDHFHLLISPSTSLEKSVQVIKGGFSFHAKKELGSNMEIWRRGFADHRIRDAEDYEKHLHYIHLNPVKKHLCASPAEYRYSSAYPGWKLDPIPQGLKPGEFLGPVIGTTEVVPFQNQNARALKPAELGAADVRAEARTLQAKARALQAEACTLQAEARTLQAEACTLQPEPSLTSMGAAKVVPFQNNGTSIIQEVEQRHAT